MKLGPLKFEQDGRFLICTRTATGECANCGAEATDSYYYRRYLPRPASRVRVQKSMTLAVNDWHPIMLCDEHDREVTERSEREFREVSHLMNISGLTAIYARRAEQRRAVEAARAEFEAGVR